VPGPYQPVVSLPGATGQRPKQALPGRRVGNGPHGRGQSPAPQPDSRRTPGRAREPPGPALGAGSSLKAPSSPVGAAAGTAGPWAARAPSSHAPAPETPWRHGHDPRAWLPLVPVPPAAALTEAEEDEELEADELLPVHLERVQVQDELLRPQHQRVQRGAGLGCDGRHVHLRGRGRGRRQPQQPQPPSPAAGDPAGQQPTRLMGEMGTLFLQHWLKWGALCRALAPQAPVSPKIAPGEGRGSFSHPISASTSMDVDVPMRNIFGQKQELDGGTG